jgi:hypothetical protein
VVNGDAVANYLFSGIVGRFEATMPIIEAL